MFNIEDKELIKKIIDELDGTDGIIIPVYLCVGKEYYSILEVEEIINCTPSVFKVGFGARDSIFIKNKFPKNKLITFRNSRVFSVFNEEKQYQTDYFTFESDNVPDDGSYLNREINNWYDLLLPWVMKSWNARRIQHLKNIMDESS